MNTQIKTEKDFTTYAQYLEARVKQTDQLAKQVTESQSRIKGMIGELQLLVDKYSTGQTLVLASKTEHRGRPSAFSIEQKNQILNEDGTIKKICAKNHISVPTYYLWKRKAG